MPSGTCDTGGWRSVRARNFVHAYTIYFLHRIDYGYRQRSGVGKYADDQSFRHGRRGAFRYGDWLRNCHKCASGDQLPDDLLGRVRGKRSNHVDGGSECGFSIRGMGRGRLRGDRKLYVYDYSGDVGDG
jgi:hypothetical protein